MEEPPRNLVGASGFVLALVSLFTVGALSPVALVVSLVGLSWRPRTFAGLGTVISLMGCGLLAGSVVVVTQAMQQAQSRVLDPQRNQVLAPALKDPKIEDIDPLIDQLESFTPEERERLRSQLKEGFTTLDELLQEAHGVPTRQSPAMPPPQPRSSGE